MTNDRAERLYKLCSEHTNESPETIAKLYQILIEDFPKFRTAEKPNEWEKGYHCVLDTIHTIALELHCLSDKSSSLNHND